MTYENGEVNPRTQEEWLELMLQHGADYWGDDITDRSGTAIHRLYEPFAGRLADLEQQLQNVLQSLRIQDATGLELDFLGQRYGIFRQEARTASGNVTFSRTSAASKDYLIQKGTIVRTEGEKQLEFETVDTVTLTQGSTEVTVGIEARQAGSEYNVAAGTITDALSMPAGVDSIENAAPTTGGSNREKDPEYRQRILNTLRNIDTASGWNIYNDLTSRRYVRDILFVDSNSDLDTPNLSAGDFEIVVDADAGYSDEISQTIFENMPMGSNPVGGNRGSKTTGQASLPNGQTFTIPYSEPEVVNIYVDASVKTTKEINKDKIIDSIVGYIGGKIVSGDDVPGDLRMGEDVIYGNVDYRIRDIEGVHDVTELYVDTTSSPAGTSNVTIGTAQKASTAASDINITLQ